MSRAGDEEDEDERFYESIDRLLSSASSCCSYSTTDDDDEDCARDLNSFPGSPNSDSRLSLLPVPRFPVGVTNNYDVWISQPSSIEERRRRLLTQMGLSRDPVLSRHRSSPSSIYDGSGSGRLPEGEVGRSVSAGQLNSSSQQVDEVSRTKSSLSIVRSRSDGAVDDLGNSCPHDQCNSSSSLNTPIISINSISPLVIQTRGGPFVNTHSVVKSESGKGWAIDNGTSINKPPTGKNGGRVEEIRNDSPSSNLNVDGNSMLVSGISSGGDIDDGSSSNGIVPINDPVCTIKNLDNGEEFVVNEVREDGMWNRLKEVGTGKQLTMEEFEICVGHSPIVQELMRRQNVEDGHRDSVDSNANGSSGSGSKLKKKGSWLKSLKSAASSMTGQKERRSSDERDTSSEKGGRRSSSATDDSQDVPFHGPEKIRVRQYGKSCKELSGLYKSQEIHAHNGSIWAIKFSLDGKYLASAGEDCVIHIWQVGEVERKGDLLPERQEDGNVSILLVGNGSPRPGSVLKNLDIYPEKKRRGRSSISRKSVSLDPVMVPETVFALSEKPILSLQGHLDDVLDLSWSKSQHLLSSSMDKTVRLWHLSSMSCLKIFSHSDYVTCIQFNPVDDRYFISGSLDAKVRIWSIPDRQVVDWNDLHEMVTAACYTPDGQGALVGSYKGSCRSYNTFGNKLQQKCQINLQNRRKKSHHRKITGFEFSPGSSSEVLITSADSRIRVVDCEELVHKFKGFRNPHSQISASLTSNGKHVVCASEDSHVYIWKHEGDSRPSRSKGVTVTHSYEHFYCQDVSVAIPWPGMWETWGFQDPCSGDQNEVSTANHPPTPVEEMMGNNGNSHLPSVSLNSPLHGTISSATNSYFFDRISATWPEEKLLLAAKASSPRVSFDLPNGLNQSRAAWGMVIVTASLKGEIRTFQNFGLPVRI